MNKSSCLLVERQDLICECVPKTLHWMIRVLHAHTHIVGGLELFFIGLVVSHPVLSNFIIVLWKSLQSLDNFLVAFWSELQVVEYSSLRVNLSLGKSALRFVFWLFEEEYQSWFNSDGLKQIDLSLVFWEAFHDPAIKLAIAWLKSVFNESVDDTIWNWLSSAPASLNGLSIGWVGRHFFSKQVIDTHLHEAELQSQFLALGSFAGGRWSQDDNLVWGLWAVGFEVQLEHIE